jgi:hypothetical protein
MRSLVPSRFRAVAAAALLAAIAGTAANAQTPVGTAFTYQGELRVSGSTSNTTADFQFRLYDAVTVGNLIGTQQAVNNATLTAGRFTTTLDFGAAAFGSSARWLEISVRSPAGSGAFVTLTPRQQIRPTPDALYASTAGAASNAAQLNNQPASFYQNASNLNAGVIGGALLSGTYTAPVIFSNTSNTFTGGGAGLAGLNAGNLASGTVNDARLSANVPRLNAANIFTASNMFGNTQFNLGDKNLQLRFDSGLVPGLNIGGTGGNLGIMRVRNRIEMWPNDAGTAPASIDLRDAAGTPMIALDGGSGNIDSNGSVRVDGLNLNDGTPGTSFLRFGSGGTGEGMGSKRTATGNQFGLDFYTGFGTRMSITNGGSVGIGTSAPAAQLHVRGPGTFRGNHVAYFENTSAISGDGIAIQIDQAHTNRDNNFVTFYNGSGTVTGRIEGFSLANGDWTNPPPQTNAALNITAVVNTRPTNQWYTPGTLPTASLSAGTPPTLSTTTTCIGPVCGIVNGVSFNSGQFPALSFNPGSLPSITNSPISSVTATIGFTPPTQQELDNLYCWSQTNGMFDFLSYDPVALATRGLLISAAQFCKDDGVTYGSKGADYAEWLERSDPKEDIKWGQIVGVRSGKISKTIKGAEQVMVVSRAPVVLGNQPPAEVVDNYERVAFMGQVPVVVRGRVHAGDYIIDSGQNDGTGVAVATADLTSEHLDRVVGRAWEDSKNDIVGFVNVVVGVNHEATTSVLARQAARIDEQAQRQAAMKADNDSLRSELAQLKTEQTRMVAMFQRLEGSLDQPHQTLLASWPAAAGR